MDSTIFRLQGIEEGELVSELVGDESTTADDVLLWV